MSHGLPWRRHDGPTDIMSPTGFLGDHMIVRQVINKKPHWFDRPYNGQINTAILEDYMSVRKTSDAPLVYLETI